MYAVTKRRGMGEVKCYPYVGCLDEVQQFDLAAEARDVPKKKPDTFTAWLNKNALMVAAVAGGVFLLAFAKK